MFATFVVVMMIMAAFFVWKFVEGRAEYLAEMDFLDHQKILMDEGREDEAIANGEEWKRKHGRV